MDDLTISKMFGNIIKDCLSPLNNKLLLLVAKLLNLINEPPQKEDLILCLRDSISQDY